MFLIVFHCLSLLSPVLSMSSSISYCPPLFFLCFSLILLCSLMLSPVFMLSLRRISWCYVFLMFPSSHLLSIACWGDINSLFSCHSCGMDDWFLFLGRLMHHRGCCMSSWFSHHIRRWTLFLRMRMMGTHNKPKGHQLLAHSNFVDVYVCSDRLLISHAGGRTFLCFHLSSLLNSSQGLLDIL